MITILGTKITVFALYGLFSLQLLAVGLSVLAYKSKSNFEAQFPAIMGAVMAELVLIVWMGLL